MIDILNSRGRVLVFIVQHPGCTIRQISSGMFLTDRTVHSLVGSLREAEALTVRKRGRINYYRVRAHLKPLIQYLVTFVGGTPWMDK